MPGTNCYSGSCRPTATSNCYERRAATSRILRLLRAGIGTTSRIAQDLADAAGGKVVGWTVGMGRYQREVVCGGTYHVMNRGNRRMPIFEDDRDRRRFVRILIEEKARHGVQVMGGTQMGNHFHLLIGTPNGNVSDFMEQLEGRYARYSNWRHDRVGHLFQGRFRHVVIEDDLHLITALCYVLLNPLSARLVTRLQDYKWGTYAATAGLAPLPSYLSIDWLPALFQTDSLREAQRRLVNLLSEADPIGTYLRQSLTSVDREAVRRVLHSYVGGQLQLGNLPRTYRAALRSKLPELVREGMPLSARAVAIYDAHVVHGYTLSEIARELRLHPSGVSKIFRRELESRTSSK